MSAAAAAWPEGEASSGQGRAAYRLCTAAVRQVSGSVDLVCLDRDVWLVVLFVSVL